MSGTWGSQITGAADLKDAKLLCYCYFTYDDFFSFGSVSTSLAQEQEGLSWVIEWVHTLGVTVRGSGAACPHQCCRVTGLELAFLRAVEGALAGQDQIQGSGVKSGW